MSNFQYLEINGKVYLSIDNKRLLVLWDKRWVPASEKIIKEKEPDIDPDTGEVDLDDESELDLENNTLELSDSFTIDEENHTLIID